MKKTKILISYDYNQDPGTTGYYILKAARALDSLEVFTVDKPVPSDLDIVFNIMPCPAQARHPRAVNCYWEIDNHLTLGSERNRYDACDILYVAQPYFLPLYDPSKTKLLLLGFDPKVHLSYSDEPIIYDVGLLGNSNYFERERLLDLIAKKYRVLRGSAKPGQEYARKLSQCKVLFNKSLDNDINMRFFEAIGMGRPFLTDRLYYQDHIFIAEQDFYEYETDEELMQKLDYIFFNYKKCLKLAQSASDEASELHTYANRLDKVLKDCEDYLNHCL